VAEKLCELKKKGGDGSGGNFDTVLKAWNQMTGFVCASVQNKTVTFTCNIGDFILVTNAVPSSVTGAAYLGESSGGGNQKAVIYAATSTSVVIRGTGNTSFAIVLLNSKPMTDNFLSVESRSSNIDENIVANKGDIVMLTGTNWSTVVDPESTVFRHLSPLGYFSQHSMYLVAETNNARYYTAGNNQPLITIHFK
jgi:hypothetical protein